MLKKKNGQIDMNIWQKVKIKDVCTKGTSSLSLKDLDGKDGDFPVYGAAGLAKKVNFYQQENKYLAIIKDGSGVGRLYRFDGKTSVLGTMQYIFPNGNVDYSFFYYALQSIDFKKYVNGAAIPHIYFKDYSQEEIPLPPMEEQKKIAARLDAVSDLLTKQKQLLSEQDNLIQSTFYDMFGDPIKNEKGWNSKKLSELGSLKNGINFQKNDNENDLYCLGVADFKDNKYISDIFTLQKVPSKSVNLTEDLLKNGDIVFVRSNGNKALVGRCVAVYPNEEAVTFSGFCIRFRKSTSLIKTDYLLYFLKTPQIRNALAGRGANIQNLNQQILSKVTILCPPLELQQKFAAIAEQIESEKSKIKSAIAETQTLFNALMSEYFED